MRDACRRRQAGRLIGAAFALAAGLCGVSVSPAAPPVVPGYSVLKNAKASEVEQGQLLLGELNCTACHKAEGAVRVEAKGAPDLSKAGERLTPQFLRAYLADPHGVKPGATMPDVFHASEAQPKAGAVEFLTHYLVSLGGPIKKSETSGNSSIVDRGRDLYHTVGCVACHAPEKPLANETVPSVPIGPQALKTTVEQLTAFLLDPLATRPHGRMPFSNLEPAEARAIATYLLREQLDNPQVATAAPARSEGLHYLYYENVTPADASLETFDKLMPKSEGTAEKPNLKIPGVNTSGDHFALKFSGIIKIPKDGKYSFMTGSDDGSRVYIDGKVVANADGVHPHTEKAGDIQLKAGDHEIVVTYYEIANDQSLIVGWQGPGFKKEVIPANVLSNIGGKAMVPLKSEEFTVDPEKAAMGGRMFAMLGCANCHAMQDVPAARQAKPLAQIDPANPEGCIAETPKKGLPKYDVSPEQRAALTAAIKGEGDLAKAFTPSERALKTMAQMNCFACHSRDKVGGIGADRNDLFVMTAKFDMGDEGRIPPGLTGVGGKLLPEAIEGIVLKGEHHIRRNRMATRMPKFAAATAGNVVQAFTDADAPKERYKVPDFDQRLAKDGRTLVGNKGLGCVNCHGVAGVASLGMPSVDLSTVHGRLRPGWFHELLVDPPKKTPGTRMPAFWYQGTVSFNNLAGGTMDGQIDAIWTYLSLGKDMPLPPGLIPGGSGMELVVGDEPLIHRTMMADVGNRSILVGFPDGLSVAFDADVVRLAKAWRGKFFDAAGWWEGRGGKHLPPLGKDIMDLPAGPSFAVLQSPSSPWPTVAPKERNVGGKFKGYVLDKQKQPTFHYILSGVDVQEKPFPILKTGGAVLKRQFTLNASQAPQGLTFLAAAGAKIEPGKEKGTWVVDGKLTVRLPADAPAVVRDDAGKKQLLLPVTFNNGVATFDVEMSW